MTPTPENDARAASRRAAHQEHQEDDDPSTSTTTAASDSDDSEDDAALLNDPQQQQQQNDQEWDEWGGDENADSDSNDAEESDRTRSLFDAPTAPPLPSPEAALAHDAAVHHFDLKAWRRRCKLDQYGVIRAVNWARKCVAEGKDPRPALRAYEEAVVEGGGGKAPVPPPAWASDEFLVPALPDDPLVTYDYEEEDGDEEEQEAQEEAKAGPSAGDIDQQLTTMQRLAAENAALRTRLQALVEATLPEELRGESALLQQGGAVKEQEEDAKPATPAKPKPTTSSAAAALIDAAYFDSYSHFDIHREMLSDVPRTQAYRDALEKNPSLTKGASVVDVGAGTGVLSLFAARGGQAASVVGIEGSARMARIARAVVAANGLSRETQDGPVAIVSGRVEALVVEGDNNNDATTTKNSLLPAPKSADVLVSEWMGYALLFESMLSSVLTARDAWLKPGGAVLPDVARVIVAGADLRAALGCGFWDDVYGLKMTPIGDEVVDGVLGCGGATDEGKEQQQSRRRPPRLLVRQVPASALRTTSAQVRELDLATMKHDDQDFTAEFECGLSGVEAASAAGPPTPAKGETTTTTPATTTTKITCLVLWFDTLFTERFCRDQPVVLSTAPTSAPTHWAQAVLPLSRPVELASNGASSSSSLRGRLSMARRQGRHRALDISVEYWVPGSTKPVVDLYSMGVNQDEEELLGEGKEDDGAPRPEATIA